MMKNLRREHERSVYKFVVLIDYMCVCKCYIRVQPCCGMSSSVTIPRFYIGVLTLPIHKAWDELNKAISWVMSACKHIM